MKIMKLTLFSLAAASLLTVSANAQINTINPFLADAPADKSNEQYLRLFDVNVFTDRGDRYLGSSQTATLYYKKGVKNFEKGKLDKADQHFRASLRADGSRGLDKATYHYLSNIHHKRGDELQSKKYAQAYYNIK